MNEWIPTLYPFGWGLLGGVLVEIVDFYWTIKKEDLNCSEAKDKFFKKYLIPCCISGLTGGIVVFAISLAPAPIWQIVVGMSALGIVTKFLSQRNNT